uniref:Fam-a protein n=1 Tax=Parastrongyloides trichosuri TaxID=131310 RepID=A0A0N4ZTI3_PARTI
MKIKVDICIFLLFFSNNIEILATNNINYQLSEKDYSENFYDNPNYDYIFSKNNNGIFYLNRFRRNHPDSLEEKIKARSKFFKGSFKIPTFKNDLEKQFHPHSLMQEQKTNIREFPFKETTMNIECLFSVKNCMSTMSNNNDNKFDVQKLTIPRNYPLYDYSSNLPSLTNWKVKKEQDNVWMKKIYDTIYSKNYLA